MAWIEQRRQQYRVYERSVTGPKVYEAFASRQDAESFKELAARFGWQRAVDHVRQPLPVTGQAPTPTPASESGQPTPMVGASLWDRAVAAGADPNTLRRSDPDLPAMASVRPAGMSVGELCRRHIDSLVGTGEETRRQYRAYVRDHVDPYFGASTPATSSASRTWRRRERVPRPRCNGAPGWTPAR